MGRNLGSWILYALSTHSFRSVSEGTRVFMISWISPSRSWCGMASEMPLNFMLLHLEWCSISYILVLIHFRVVVCKCSYKLFMHHIDSQHFRFNVLDTFSVILGSKLAENIVVKSMLRVYFDESIVSFLAISGMD